MHILAGLENVTNVQNKCVLCSVSEDAEHDKKKKMLGRIYGTWEYMAENVALAGVCHFKQHGECLSLFRVL